MKTRHWFKCIRGTALLCAAFLVSTIRTTAADVIGQPLSDSATHLPEGYAILPQSLSPDGRIGVLAPDADHEKAGVPQNKLFEKATGILLAPINATTGTAYDDLVPTAWSNDGNILRWVVAGKWFPRAFVLIKLDQGKVQWQTNVLKTAQDEILSRVRRANPAAYAAAKKYNEGKMGSAYPEGFTVNVSPVDDYQNPPTLPYALKVSFMSNPKGIEGFPKNAELEASMTATVDAGGKFTVGSFKLEGEPVETPSQAGESHPK